MTPLETVEAREDGRSEPIRRPARPRRRAFLGVAAFIFIGLLAAAGWVYFNGLPLPVLAGDRAAILTARDLEPWVPGLSALDGTETTRKRMTFFWSMGTDTEYSYENRNTPTVGLRCTVTLRPTEEEAAGTFDGLAAAAQMVGTVFNLGKLLDPSFPSFSQTERDDLLPWGDASKCLQYGEGSMSATSFVARKGRRVFALLMIGSRISDEGLREVLLPRLEALGRG